MARFATGPVPAGEACPVCEEGFEPGERGVAFEADGTLRRRHIHVRCVDGNVVRHDLQARLRRAAQRLAGRFAGRT